MNNLPHCFSSLNTFYFKLDKKIFQKIDLILLIQRIISLNISKIHIQRFSCIFYLAYILNLFNYFKQFRRYHYNANLIIHYVMARMHDYKVNLVSKHI